SNLLLDTQGTVWITDFGLAKADDSGELTNPGDLVGTLRFMAPERFQGQADPRSDVYSLGITLYEMLTLRPAFDHTDRPQLIKRVTHEDPPRPRKLDPHIPRDLETIVLKAIAKEPADRYPTAAALAEDLRRFLVDRPIRARRTGLPERTWRWGRRNPAVAALTVFVALLLVVVTVVSSVSALWLRQERDRVVRAKEDLDKEQQQTVKERDRAEEAERDGKERLWESLRDQARALRLSRHSDQRVKSLKAIQEALQLPLPPGHSLGELRTEAIAALALPDVEVLQEWVGGPAGTVGLDFDSNLERYARLAIDGTVSVRRVSNDAEIARWQEPTEGDWPSDESNLRFSPDGRYLCIRH